MTRDEAGQVAGVEMLLFGVLVFVLGLLVVSNAWAVIDGKLAAIDAAGQAVRAAGEADTVAAAQAGALSAAADAMAAQRRDPSRLTVVLSGNLARCGRIQVEVGYRLALVTVPLLGGLGHGFTVHAVHSELVDPYRSGLPGEAACAGT